MVRADDTHELLEMLRSRLESALKIEGAMGSTSAAWMLVREALKDADELQRVLDDGDDHGGCTWCGA